MKHLFVVGGVVVLVCVSVYVYLNMHMRDSNQEACEARVTLREMRICADVADEHAERVQGLSGREVLEHEEGLLFIFDQPGEYGIWMKDMRFPIDVVWLDAQGRVVHTEANVPVGSYPKSYRTPLPASYVLEINAGMLAEYDIHNGDQATIK